MEDRTILLRMLASLLVASWSLRMRTDSGTGDRLAIEAPVTGKMRTFTRDGQPPFNSISDSNCTCVC